MDAFDDFKVRNFFARVDAGELLKVPMSDDKPRWEN